MAKSIAVVATSDESPMLRKMAPLTAITIAEQTAREEGKPEQALPKIVEGRVNGYYKENVLLDQAFAKEPKKTVQKVLDEAGASVTGFARFRVGN